MALQAYGELMALRAHHIPKDVDAYAEIDTLLDPELRGTENRLAERIGLALAAAKLWDEPSARLLSTNLLVSLIPGATDRLARAILSVFRGNEALDPDVETHRLLGALARDRAILAWLDEGWLLEKLEGLLPHEAQAGYEISRELVKLRGELLGSLQSGWALHTSQLTTIAITLQRMEAPLREEGLELFEALLDLHISEAEVALMELDQRLPPHLTGFFPSSPSRRRRLKKSTL